MENKENSETLIVVTKKGQWPLIVAEQESEKESWVSRRDEKDINSRYSGIPRSLPNTKAREEE